MVSNILNRLWCLWFVPTFLSSGFILLVTFSTSVLADEKEAVGVSANTELPAAIQEKVTVFQNCVNAVMSGFEKAAIKREQIAEQCKVARNELVDAFPDQIRPLIATSTDRRIESVLNALENIEGVVVESAIDVNEIAEELQALDESAASE